LRPDVAIDLQGLTKSAIAAWLSGAPTRIGFAGCDGRELSSWLNNTLVNPLRTHVIDRNLELLGPLGIVPQDVRFGLPGFEEEAVAIGRFLCDRGLGAGFAVMNTGAGWASKRWPPEHYARVARHLGARHQIRSVVAWAGPDEQRWADEVVVGAGGFAQMAPRTSLGELAALVRRAEFFLGSDTGPMHLAAALGTPCIALHGPTSGRRNGPYGEEHIVLQKVLLQGGSRERRNADNASMRAIDVEDVCAACDTMLARVRRPLQSRRPLEALAA
jgi:ADP-heptose:LPS heptosyltransferase